ncbi:endonuclease exonuclease phosphatase family protein [Stylonychia lemnae]|uniref:Endonuclease exonuclease phosphatase family protein n=1 Tax=Stylonychia lemnae TaxID=5949 RepID=A0A078A0Q9_STYLE|nr:endonuclease exonuclease phosphatase family protein [Stylonychia lemnae]|eukprot:CDW74384.1 endonuclease exonuclease phosphatase family protein [Stylonychia lemnae]
MNQDSPRESDVQRQLNEDYNSEEDEEEFQNDNVIQQNGGDTGSLHLQPNTLYQYENQENGEFYKSVNMFHQMKQINEVYQSFERLSRQPQWKWDPMSLTQSFNSQGANQTPGNNDPYESKKLKVFSCTWNIHGQLPNYQQVEQLLRARDIYHDIYVIATQECQRSIASAVFAPSKEKWEGVLQDYLGQKYVNISSYALGATHLIIFAHIMLTPIISEVESECIATGISNIVGNKGGVGISFKIGTTRILCISAHLAAGHNNIEKRNQDWLKIFRRIALKLKDDSSSKNQVTLSNDSSTMFDGIIWLGDFNYRINGVAGAIKVAMEKNMYEVLINNDQFGFEHKIGRIAWNFKEGQIEFAPTYKLKKHQDLYDMTHRLPGWTDRIIYSTQKVCNNSKEVDVLVQKSYDSNNNLKISDHRPVFSQFEMNFEISEQYEDHLMKTISPQKHQKNESAHNFISKTSDLNSIQSSNSMTATQKVKRNQVLNYSTFSDTDLERAIQYKVNLMKFDFLQKQTERDFNKSKSKGCSIY